MVQEEVLEEVRSGQLAVYVVWEPIMATDGEVPARRATSLVPDPRAIHFWTDATDVGEAFQSALALDGEPAWDVYLLYPPGVEWNSNDAPSPTYFMHQLGGRLPDDRLLNGGALAEKVREVLRLGGSADGR